MVTGMIPESDSTMTSATAIGAFHAARIYAQWSQLQSLIQRKKIIIDGESLNIPGLVAVARLVICRQYLGGLTANFYIGMVVSLALIRAHR